jgi:hypothetical protein
MVAFTGRADELTEAQKTTLRAMLQGYPEICVGTNRGKGADEWIAEFCEDDGCEMWETDASLTPMARNRQLASECNILIGAPPTEHVLKRGSGTWETIKYGWRYGKKVLVVTPSGKIHRKRESVPTREES